MKTLVLTALVVGATSVAFADENTSTFPPPSPELLAPQPHSTGQPSMHPPVILRDATGTPVLTSGAAVSAPKTCDGCHDVKWIQGHDLHGGLTTDEMGRGRDALPSGNCFLCHVHEADNRARAQAIGQGQLDWTETATLLATGVVGREGAAWKWQKDRFQSDGAVSATALGLGRPSNRACGSCHGSVYENPAPLSLDRDPAQHMTDLCGVVFSGQRISDSAINIEGKEHLTRPWDVHAERMVSCASCHFSPNHPAYAFAQRGPEHLQFDARRIAITEYLRRPDHRLAKGPSGTFPHRQDGDIRRCESCHDASKVHGFLPRAERHFSALLCESCHVPMLHAPARQETDWTVLTAEHGARIVYRGVRADGFVTGFRPFLLPRMQADGSSKLGPANAVTTYRWVEQGPSGRRPVARATLEQACFTAGAHRPELVRALDGNGDGKLQDAELVLDSADKIRMVGELLVAAGARDPVIVGEVKTHEIHHGVVPGRFANRDCASCHGTTSRIDASMVVAATAPFGVTPTLADAATPASLVALPSGGFAIAPKPEGLHVFGHTRSGFLDGLGMVLFAGAIAGAGGHALLRIRGARRRKKDPS